MMKDDCVSFQEWYLRLKNAVFFNMTIRVFLESYIEIALTSALNLKNVSDCFFLTNIVTLQEKRRLVLFISLDGTCWDDWVIANCHLSFYCIKQESDARCFSPAEIRCLL